MNPEWHEVNTTGSKPASISHHSSLVYQNKMYLFGGSMKGSENLNLYALDLIKDKWEIVKTKPQGGKPTNIPNTRDEHSCVFQDNGMVIFGGFEFGERSNDMLRFSFIDHTWERLSPLGDDRPCARAGHSAVVRLNPAQGDCMYIFGGKDDDNNKLCDTWKFNFKTMIWT